MSIKSISLKNNMIYSKLNIDNMKKFLLLLSLVCIRQVNAQTWVTIPDANFVTCLQNYVPAAMHGDSLNTSSTLVTTTTYSITVSSRSIANLFGIQYFTSLTYLNCSYNSLTNLPALPNTLIYLDCGTNSITNLPALPNTLTNLLCNWNALTSLPALPNTLTYLDCYVNSITNLPALPNTLTELNCSNNTLTSLPTLPNALNYLSCHHNSIPCFRPFSNSMMGLDIDPNPYYCLPNYISCMNTTDLAMPLCLAGNSNGCTVTGIEQPFELPAKHSG